MSNGGRLIILRNRRLSGELDNGSRSRRTRKIDRTRRRRRAREERNQLNPLYRPPSHGSYLSDIKTSTRPRFIFPGREYLLNISADYRTTEHSEASVVPAETLRSKRPSTPRLRRNERLQSRIIERSLSLHAGVSFTRPSLSLSDPLPDGRFNYPRDGAPHLINIPRAVQLVDGVSVPFTEEKKTRLRVAATYRDSFGPGSTGGCISGEQLPAWETP